MGNPPPFSGNARKKTGFSFWGLPLHIIIHIIQWKSSNPAFVRLSNNWAMYFLKKVQCLVSGDGHGLVKIISVHGFCGNGDDAFFLKYLLLAISIRHSCPDIRVLARKFVDISVLSCFKPPRQLYTYHRSLSQSLGHREWPFWPWPWQLTINRPLDQWSSNTSKNT